MTQSPESEIHCGTCLCGAVKITVRGVLGEINACHCTACRKHSGHDEASVDVPRAALCVEGARHVAWYQSSEKVRRGFCATCGSTLFWDPVFQDWTSIAMGAFDTPTKTWLARHMFVSEKGDYYTIMDGLPQNAQ